MDKIIFLDFDGVLNSGDNNEVISSLSFRDDAIIRSYKPGMMFDERCVRWLNWIINETNCKIVISSSWRLYYELDELKQIWTDLSMQGEILDYTPFCSDVSIDENDEIVRDFERGNEIQLWLDTNNPHKYCIIDDDYCMLPEQVFVQTDSEFGLTSETAKLIVSYLNN